MFKLQKAYDMIGTYGCYLLCLLRLAKKEDRATEYYKKYLASGYIDEECTILNPCAILDDLVKRKYTVQKIKGDVDKSYYDDKHKYIIVQYWFNPDTGLHHFKLPYWDSFGKSVTCSNPKSYIESVRLFTLKG